MKYLNTKTASYEVQELENGKLEFLLNGKPYENAGLLIAGCGGIEAVKARLSDVQIMPKQHTPIDNESEYRAAREICRKADATAEELLKAVKVLSHQTMVDPTISYVMSGENSLTKALLAYGGSYTFNTYESGETVIKFDDGRRFTTNDRNSKLRNTKPILSILRGYADQNVCPCCGHKLGGWTNSASAENGKKGGRPRKDGMNIHNYQTIMHISFDDNKFIELDFDGVFDVYGDKEEYANAEEAEAAFDADYLEELLDKAHASGVELTQDQVDQIMRRMVQWRDRIGDYF